MTDKRPTNSAHRNVFVPFPDRLVPVHIVRRRNRFAVDVQPVRNGGAETAGTVHHQPYAFGCDAGHPFPAPGTASFARGAEAREPSGFVTLHLPNSGRMAELLTPGTVGLASMDAGKGRKTDGTLLLVHYNDRWVSVDARMPNRLFRRGMETNQLTPFLGYDEWRSEVSWGKGRIDFMLTSPTAPPFLVETKSCNLVENGLALFPDAPTARGARHLAELAEAVQLGYRAAVVWFVQRDDARRLAAHRRADAAFAEALNAALSVGVQAYAYRCRVTVSGVRVIDDIPVETIRS